MNVFRCLFASKVEKLPTATRELPCGAGCQSNCVGNRLAPIRIYPDLCHDAAFDSNNEALGGRQCRQQRLPLLLSCSLPGQ